MATTRLGAREFFQVDVLPTVTAWKIAPTDLRLAKHAAVSLNQLADYYWHDFAGATPNLVFNQTSLNQFRRKLVSQFPSFALIRDVAESHKHVKLDRADRVLTKTEQTSVGSLGYGEAEYDVGTYGGAPEIVVELDSGQRRHFSSAVAEVEKMWEELLTDAGV